MPAAALTPSADVGLFDGVISRRAFLGVLPPVCMAGGCAHSRDAGPREAWKLTALNGDEVVWRPPPGTRAVVFEFLGVECPISNRALPELSRLARDLEPEIVFVAVYPNAGEDADAVRRHRADFQLSGPAFRDPRQRLADSLGVGVTPEVVALTPDGRLIYRGRINDQFGGLGQGRPAPTRHDLAESLAAFRAGMPAAGTLTQPVGCRIDRAP